MLATGMTNNLMPTAVYKSRLSLKTYIATYDKDNNIITMVVNALSKDAAMKIVCKHAFAVEDDDDWEVIEISTEEEGLQFYGTA